MEKVKQKTMKQKNAKQVDKKNGSKQKNKSSNIVIIIILIAIVVVLTSAILIFLKRDIDTETTVEKNIKRIFEDEINDVGVATSSYITDDTAIVDLSKINLEENDLSNVNLSLKRAKDMIKADLEVEDQDIKFTKITLEDENGYARWIIDFDINGTFGEYVIGSYDGRILSSNLKQRK